MEQKRLALYTIDMKYVRNLSIAEERRRGKKHNHVFSVSPQSGKDIRPFIGVIVICGDKQYCVPLSSPKEKHNTMNNDVDFSKVYSPKGKLIGVLNFNDMIPVRDDVIRLLDVNPHKGDSQAMIQYKILARNRTPLSGKPTSSIVLSPARKLILSCVHDAATSRTSSQSWRSTPLKNDHHSLFCSASTRSSVLSTLFAATGTAFSNRHPWFSFNTSFTRSAIDPLLNLSLNGPLTNIVFCIMPTSLV